MPNFLAEYKIEVIVNEEIYADDMEQALEVIRETVKVSEFVKTGTHEGKISVISLTNSEEWEKL